MPRCEKCQSELKRLPRSAMQQMDSFMFPGTGDLLYAMHAARYRCVSCGHEQRVPKGFASRLFTRLIVIAVVILACVFVGLGLQNAEELPALREGAQRLAEWTAQNSLGTLFAAAGAMAAILVLAIDAARRRH
jgi:hypothetical protein